MQAMALGKQIVKQFVQRIIWNSPFAQLLEHTLFAPTRCIMRDMRMANSSFFQAMSFPVRPRVKQ